MEIIKKKIDELTPADYNPRKDLKPGDVEYEKLKRSFTEFGYVEPVIWNKRTGRIVGGHQRWKVLKELGVKELDCVEVDFDEKKEKALNVALNKISGDWDKEKLTDLLVDLDSRAFDLSLTGFDQCEIDDLFDVGGDVKEDDFDVEEELKSPCISKPGDIWQIGRHRVICGDSTVSDTYVKLLEGKKVNLVCTDPPYLVALENKSGKIKNDDLNDKDGYEFLLKAFKNLKEAMTVDASIYVFYATMKARIFYDAYEDAGFKVGAGLIWKKPKAPFMRTDWKFNMEPLIWGWRKDGKHIWYGDQKQKSIFEFDGIKDSATEGCGHPSSKPVPLIAYLIKQCTQSNGVVLDAFLGSASTLIACEQMDRICYGIEYEPKFVDVAVKRYIAFKDEDESDVYLIRDGKKIAFAELETENKDNLKPFRELF